MTAVALPAGLALMTTGCLYDEEGSGEMATVHYNDLDDHDITGLSVFDDFEVRVVVDPSLTQSAEVVVDDNLIDRGYASLDVDGMLTIGFDGLGLVDPSETPQVTLTINELDTIENHGDGDVEVHATDVIEGEISGDADVVVYGDPASSDVDVEGEGALVTA